MHTLLSLLSLWVHHQLLLPCQHLTMAPPPTQLSPRPYPATINGKYKDISLRRNDDNFSQPKKKIIDDHITCAEYECVTSKN